MYFDRFDVVEAHMVFAALYHTGQDSELYRRLCRCQRLLNNHGLTDPDMLTENGEAIFAQLLADHEYDHALASVETHTHTLTIEGDDQ